MQTQDNQVFNRPLISCEQLAVWIGLKPATIHAKRNPVSPSYDPSFPLPYRISEATLRWCPEEIEDWLHARRCEAAA